MVRGILPDCVWRSLQLMTYVMSYLRPPFYLSVGPAGASSPSMPAEGRLSNWANRAAVRTVQPTGKSGFHPTVLIFYHEKLFSSTRLIKVNLLCPVFQLIDSFVILRLHNLSTRTHATSLQPIKPTGALFPALLLPFPYTEQLRNFSVSETRDLKIHPSCLRVRVGTHVWQEANLSSQIW